MRVSSSYILAFFHAIVWAAILFFPFFIADPDTGYAIGAVPGAFFTLAGLIHLGIFYVNAYYFFPKFFNRRTWWLYVLLSILLVGVSLVLKTILLHSWFSETLVTPVANRIIFAPSFGIYVISIVYRKILDTIRRERLQKEERAEQLATELKFLRSQINPHFLFNTLTNLVSLARKKSELLEPALIQLSDLMRYMLYDTQGKRVPLLKEITYLRNYIGLQQLRFGEHIDVSATIELSPDMEEQSLIEPMLLIPFVENAFKHGTSHLEHPEIVIHLTGQQGQLVFRVSNRIAPSSAETSKDRNSGIGLANVKKRLDLLYGNAYRLDIGQQNGWYEVTLKLTLS
ncbi:sensor histidine kinase [Parapedobacter indicus]|uniref:Histidine kinase n=1 Tax=Parapedobacter indicus TaxID=1477437 RepID=A0A1I3GRV2_9SPHI|nr:histidine kinase [Parapedobacter indicus]PPL02757.1 histidine kinase [Parapedobacter indicus]SFI26116.1 Histidine kinase [Parapedobacter indicus]